MVQVVKCQKCDSIFAACAAPFCYTDKEWQKDLRKYAKRGDKVDLIATPIELKGCDCRKNKTLFNLENNEYRTNTE